MGAQLIFIRQLLIKERAVFSELLFVVLQRILIEKIVQRRILSVYVKIAKRRNGFDIVQDVKKSVFYFEKTNILTNFTFAQQECNFPCFVYNKERKNRNETDLYLS